MKFNFRALLAAAGVAAFAFSPANAFEAGPAMTKPGSFIGSSSGVPGPGIYMFNQIFTYQGNFVGPNAPSSFGRNVYVDAQGFVFVPGWTFLGASYDAVIVQPFVAVAISGLGPLNEGGVNISGMFNTYIVPFELAWNKLGGTGFGVKTGLALYVPTGTIGGAAGLNNVGSPWVTFQPELILSYLGGGWNMTAAIYDEIYTANSRTNYTTGNIFHVDFNALYTIGKWTFGPVGYYAAQISDDKCPVGICTAFYGVDALLTHTQRYQQFALGGLIGYDFGPANASVWVTQDILAKASNSAAVAAGLADQSLVPRGTTYFFTLGYALWTPPAPPAAPMYHK
jgi:hypothetical protein